MKTKSPKTNGIKIKPLRPTGLRPLTNKQRIFVKHIIDNPKSSATEAAVVAYDNPTKETAASIAYENLRKPQIVTELAKYNGLMESTLVNTVNDYKESDKLGERTLAVDVAKYIHDKVHGKATQRTEVRTEGVTLTIDLTSALGTDES